MARGNTPDPTTAVPLTVVPERMRKMLPDDFRTGNPEKYLTVLDGMLDFKLDLLRKALRVYCPPLLTSLPYLRRRAEDVGWYNVPYDFPKLILDAMILNAEAVFSLAGSYKGLDYWLRILTQGAPTVTGLLLPQERYIIPGDQLRGYMSHESNWNGESFLTLFSGELHDVQPGTLSVSVATPYYNLASLQKYIETTIRQMLGFTSSRTTITITLVQGPYVPNPHANPYFVNPVI